MTSKGRRRGLGSNFLTWDIYSSNIPHKSGEKYTQRAILSCTHKEKEIYAIKYLYQNVNENNMKNLSKSKKFSTRINKTESFYFHPQKCFALHSLVGVTIDGQIKIAVLIKHLSIHLTRIDSCPNKTFTLSIQITRIDSCPNKTFKHSHNTD